MHRSHPIAARLAFGLALLAAALTTPAGASPLSIAIAPFVDEAPGFPIAATLAEQLATREVDRLLPPGSFVAEPVFEPRPEEIRRWAYRAAVDSVVVGRVLPIAAERGAGSARRVEVVLHSGHSGAELARHEVVAEGPTGLAAAAERLAGALLESLGYAPSAAEPSPPPAAAVAGAGAGAGETAGSGSSGRGLDASFDLAGFRGDAPIEIKADEAEIINLAQGRELIFQRNVRVRQANVLLRSDRLEASYDKGESEPRKLVARGRVKVDQGDRTARCDRAVYLRDAQQLTCIGHAELVQGCDIVRGDRIRFDLADDRARVEGAASIVIRPEQEEGQACPDVQGVL